MLTRRQYYWKRFKMEWLVPNWGRARGPAFWIWRAMDWWRWNMSEYNGCSLRRRIEDWWHEKAVGWLTPWLVKSRDLLYLVREENGTKLLDYGANYFSVRTRDANQYYIRGAASLTGMVTITITQYMQNGESINLFMHSIPKIIKAVSDPNCTEEDLEDEVPVTAVTRTAFHGRVPTEAQFLRAMAEVLRLEEIGFDIGRVNFWLMARKLKPKEGDEYRKFIRVYRDRIMERIDPGHGPFNEHSDWDAYFDAEDNMSVDEMIKMMEGWKNDR